jgi:hypothetical protein
VDTGLSTLVVSIAFFSGVQLISLGVLGEYVAPIFNEVKGRRSSSPRGWANKYQQQSGRLGVDKLKRVRAFADACAPQGTQGRA